MTERERWRLKSDYGVACEIDHRFGGWTRVRTIDPPNDCFELPHWLFEKAWERVPDVTCAQVQEAYRDLHKAEAACNHYWGGGPIESLRCGKCGVAALDTIQEADMKVFDLGKNLDHHRAACRDILGQVDPFAKLLTRIASLEQPTYLLKQAETGESVLEKIDDGLPPRLKAVKAKCEEMIRGILESSS